MIGKGLLLYFEVVWNAKKYRIFCIIAKIENEENYNNLGKKSKFIFNWEPI